jgi:hypothetical protein
MKRIVICICLLARAGTNLFSEQAAVLKPSGPYLGQKPPGMLPEQFGLGMIDDNERVFAISFSPDGKECFYTKSFETNTIMTAKEVNGQWTRPAIADFSGKFFDFEPHLVPDGNKMIFGSMRPLPEMTEASGLHQWMIEKTNDGWSKPKPMASPFRDGFCMYVSVVNNGNIYFTGEDGIYMSKYSNGKYLQPEKLGDNINRLQYAAHPFVGPDESYLIYDAQPEEGNADLFISFKEEDQTWGKSVSLGEKFNTELNDMTAFISRDGKYFFFSRLSKGTGDIFWVDAKIIDEMRPKK